MKRLSVFNFILFSLWAIALVSPSEAHRFYSSLSQVYLLDDRQEIQVIHHIAAHDYYDRLARNYYPIPDPSDEKYRQILKDYINQNFFIIGDEEQSITLEWVSFDRTTDDLIILQRYKSTQAIKDIKLYNQILQDTFPQQTNHTNIEFDSQTYSYNSRDNGRVINHSFTD